MTENEVRPTRPPRSALISALVLLLLAIALVCLPLKIGEVSTVPVVGTAQSLTQTYCERTFGKVAATFGAVKTVDMLISSTRQIEIDVTPAGLGVGFHPGEILAAADDQLKRLGNVLFALMTLLGTGKYCSGLLFFVILKVLVPLSLAVLALCRLLPERTATLARGATRLLSCAILILAIMPSTALLDRYVCDTFLDARIASAQKDIDSNTEQIRRTERDISERTASLHIKALETQQKMLAMAITEAGRAAPSNAGFWRDGQPGNGKAANEEKRSESQAGSGAMSLLMRAVSAPLDYVKQACRKLSDMASGITDSILEVLIMLLISGLVIPLLTAMAFVLIARTLLSARRD